MTLKYIQKVRGKRYKLQSKDKRRPGIICPVVAAKKFDDLEENNIKPSTTAEDAQLIRAAIQKNDFLKNILTEIHIEKMIEHLHERKVSEREVLLEQGNYSCNLFISKCGTFQVTENDKVVSKLDGHPTIFGEVAVLYKAKAEQTVQSLSEGVVWVLDCVRFKNLLVKSAIERQDELLRYLKNVPVLSTVPEDRLYPLIDLFKVQVFPASTLIIKEGEVCEKFYIVTAGTALALKRGTKKVEKLPKGSYFGESVLKKETSSSSVVANPPGVECLVLSKTEFFGHFATLDDLLRGKSEQNAENFEYSKLDLINFKRIRILGIGGFGRVELVQHVKKRELIFALKCLKKHEIVGKSQITQVFNEKNLQMACDNNFIVKLYRTFKDSKYIYFLLEPCLGGDLWSLLRKQNRKCFDTDAAKFYAGCIVEAFGYLHSHDIIYRDLKPENVMVDSNGYLKLTDFGFSRIVHPNEKANSFVGTAEYVSPELIQNKPHDKGVDYWALGIFIFEILTGKSPFKNDEHNDLKTYKLILKGIDSVVFPAAISPRARNLIKRLCRPLSIDRLGCLKNGIKDIEEHPWFSKLDWGKLRSMQLEPPIKIHLRGNTDTCYFEEFKHERDDALDDYSSWDDEF